MACLYIFKILKAIAYCHSYGVVHRDIKLENFLFESKGEGSEIKLIDFGLSRFIRPNETISNSVGTPYYVSPEVLEGQCTGKIAILIIHIITYLTSAICHSYYLVIYYIISISKLFYM